MRIDERTYAALPPKLQALFQKVPNPAKSEVMEAFAAFGEKNGGGHGEASQWSVASRSVFDGYPNDRSRAGGLGDTGTAARFFYAAKASKDDRMGTTHPTTKPTELIKWLCKLVNPPGGTILDPFAGSGTLAVAATRLGMDAVLIDNDPESIAMINQRLRILAEETPLFPSDSMSENPPEQRSLFG